MVESWTDGELVFSLARGEDLADIEVMLAKPAVCEHVFFGPNTPEQTQDYFQPMIDAMWTAIDRGEPPQSHLFTIRDRGGNFIGQCALVGAAYAEGNYIVGYQLDEPWWGRGIGTRACAFLVWLGFSRLGARRLSADCLASNDASARILQKMGFVPEGVQRGYYTVDGQPRDNRLFGLLRDEVPVDLQTLGRRYRARGRRLGPRRPAGF